jgi:hypothetical protein
MTKERYKSMKNGVIDVYLGMPTTFITVFATLSMQPNRCPLVQDITAIAWSKNIEPYCHCSDRAAIHLHSRGGPKLDREGIVLWGANSDDMCASLPAFWDPCPGNKPRQ